jgi:hypothetical protein
MWRSITKDRLIANQLSRKSVRKYRRLPSSRGRSKIVKGELCKSYVRRIGQFLGTVNWGKVIH